MSVVTESTLPGVSSTRSEEAEPQLELSVVMPCLNEAETLGACIEKARRSLDALSIRGEIIVADNGSTDGSREIAARLGARVVCAENKGYGNALRAGIDAACGRYVIMGDSDDSYDFSQIPLFLEKLHHGFDVVMGNRFQGGIEPGAMPPLHRYLGNPILTSVARLFFGSPCGDNHCGLRGFSREAYARLGLRATGWEFGSEMLVKANLFRLRVAEVPTRLAPDGRSRPPHLRTWEAGWRHLRLMLLHCPRWLFLYPGVVLMLAGLAVGIWLFPGPRTVGQITFNVHTLLYAATAVLLGNQAITFSTFAKVFAISEGLLPEDPRLEKFFRFVTLETGLLVGGALVLIGLAGSLYAVSDWGASHFGPLDSTHGLRMVIPSATALALGGQVILSSFFLSVLRLRTK